MCHDITRTFVNHSVTSMLDRIRQLLAEQQLSSTQFADTIGVSRPVVSHILSGRNKPSLEVVQKIIAAFPDVSINWLLTGTGAIREHKAPPEVPAQPKRKPAAAPGEVMGSAEAGLAASAGISTENPVTTPVKPLLPPEPPQTPASSLAKPIGPVPQSDLPVVPASGQSSQPIPTATSDVALAQALAETGKLIRRIVIFYQDGTFAAYQPE
jgi:DNA-binding XRE family transcriptional regulator